MPYVTTTDHTKLFYKSWGTGQPVILAHGWPLNADSWDDVALDLANAGFQAIAYDRRGFGRSDQPWQGYDYDTLAADLAAVIEHCAEGQQVAIAGFSMGGGEVARYLSKHGTSNVSHAILVSSVVPYMLKTADNPNGIDQSAFDGMTDGMVSDRPGFMQSFAEQFYGVGWISSPVSKGVLDVFFQSAMMAGQHPTLACAKAFATTDFRPDCAAFTMPTLILHGTSDNTVPIDGSAREAIRLIPHARLIEYDGEPHGTLVTVKKKVARDMIDFLRGAEVSPREENTSAFAFASNPDGLQQVI